MNAEIWESKTTLLMMANVPSHLQWVTYEISDRLIIVEQSVHTQNTMKLTEVRVRVNSTVERVWRETDIGKHKVRGKLFKNTKH
jgi:hypothetical protein